MMSKWAKSNFTKISAYIHIGDFAYDLENDGGSRGDGYMKMMEPITSTYPYMVTAGNHETFANFSNFNMRFRMPYFEDTQNFYYSYNIENVHFITMNLDLIILNPDVTEYMQEWLI